MEGEIMIKEEVFRMNNEELRNKYIKKGYFWNARKEHNERCMTVDVKRAFDNALNEARADERAKNRFNNTNSMDAYDKGKLEERQATLERVKTWVEKHRLKENPKIIVINQSEFEKLEEESI